LEIAAAVLLYGTQLAVSKNQRKKKQIMPNIKDKQHNKVTFSLNWSWRGRQAKSMSNELLLPAGLSPP